MSQSPTLSSDVGRIRETGKIVDELRNKGYQTNCNIQHYAGDDQVLVAPAPTQSWSFTSNDLKTGGNT